MEKKHRKRIPYSGPPYLGEPIKDKPPLSAPVDVPLVRSANMNKRPGYLFNHFCPGTLEFIRFQWKLRAALKNQKNPEYIKMQDERLKIMSEQVNEERKIEDKEQEEMKSRWRFLLSLDDNEQPHEPLTEWYMRELEERHEDELKQMCKENDTDNWPRDDEAYIMNMCMNGNGDMIGL